MAKAKEPVRLVVLKGRRHMFNDPERWMARVIQYHQIVHPEIELTFEAFKKSEVELMRKLKHRLESK